MAQSDRDLKVYWPIGVPEMRPVLRKILLAEIAANPPQNLQLSDSNSSSEWTTKNTKDTTS